MKLIRSTGKGLELLIARNLKRKNRIQEKVAKILEAVRVGGDEALVRYAYKFDKVKLLPRQLRVTASEISAAYQDINPEFVNMLKVVIENITRFYKRQLKKAWKFRAEEGVVLGQLHQPLDSVGIYVPAGTAPLISSVYMAVLPARAAGVKKIVLVSPPMKNGNINPYILVVANLLKVDDIYKVGGAQAIAALSFGTKMIPKVDKIIGPGNIFVTEAKRQVFGYVDIDMLAGPTELVVIANRYSPSHYVVADLLAQIEHAGGLGVLITPSKALAKYVREQVPGGYIIAVKNLEEAVEISNRIAPEHLEIMVKNPAKLLKQVHHAGAVFLGPFSPVAIGDYIAGPSHILPTGGTARFFSGLSVDDFQKRIQMVSYSRRSLERIKEPLQLIASLEGMAKHWESVKIRLTA